MMTRRLGAIGECETRTQCLGRSKSYGRGRGRGFVSRRIVPPSAAGRRSASFRGEFHGRKRSRGAPHERTRRSPATVQATAARETSRKLAIRGRKALLGPSLRRLEQGDQGLELLPVCPVCHSQLIRLLIALVSQRVAAAQSARAVLGEGDAGEIVGEHDALGTL